MLGCDIVELDRIRRAHGRFGDKFIDKILSKREKEVFLTRKKSSISYLAGRFAAKESIAKSLKTGLGSTWFYDIEILSGERGEPLVYICGERREDIEVSISHGRDYAVAVSLIR
ncbi:holo-ACP synthase [Limisalsivibrio acetivorans]|uniref:holo-ACP synthase n=1 Tax=Limisalsivibrio acetivorans TaxID=1304888 RepID=UPI0003B2FB65|nr:holo-ACP synthase [Limisalsivibrio acetivorans]